MNVDCKQYGSVFSDGTNNWLPLHIYDNPDRVYHRTAKVTLGSYNNANAWDIIADSSNDDRFMIQAGVRTIDPTNKLFLPNPLFVVISDTFWD